jgi:hypothetical protein
MATARDKVLRNDPLTKAIAKVVRDTVAKPNVRAIAEALLAAQICDGYAPKRVVDVCRASVRSVQRTRRHEAATLRELTRPTKPAEWALASDYFKQLVNDELSRLDDMPEPARDRGAQKAYDSLTDHACHIFGLQKPTEPTSPQKQVTHEGVLLHKIHMSVRELRLGRSANLVKLLRALLVASGMDVDDARELIKPATDIK